jgi:7-carboxy-7-deazaguanine synthase
VKLGYLSEIFVSFQGEGAEVGRRHLFVRLAGCNMRCTYCDTPDSLERTARCTVFAAGRAPLILDNPVSVNHLTRIISDILAIEAPVDAIAITGGEPLVQSDFLAAFLGGLSGACPVLLETNGVLPRRLGDMLPLVDIISMDLKLPSNTHEGAFWEEHAEFLEIARTKRLYVKILVDQWTVDADMERAVQMLVPLRPAVPTFLQPIVSPGGAALIDADQLARLYRIARARLETVRVLPQTHKLLGIQ